MVKKNLEILEWEPKKTKADKEFIRFKTNEGWMSCFDVISNEALKKLKGKTASVEVVESGDFSNIRKCYGEEDNENEDKAEVEVEKHPVKTEGTENRNKTMYVSYVKDIFCETFENSCKELSYKEHMKQCIELVKQIKDSF